MSTPDVCSSGSGRQRTDGIAGNRRAEHPAVEGTSGRSSCLLTVQMKKLVKSLDEARGAGTSMITLVIPPKVCAANRDKADEQQQVSIWANMLTQEYGTASNIKSRVNR